MLEASPIWSSRPPAVLVPLHRRSRTRRDTWHESTSAISPPSPQTKTRGHIPDIHTHTNAHGHTDLLGERGGTQHRCHPGCKDIGARSTCRHLTSTADPTPAHGLGRCTLPRLAPIPWTQALMPARAASGRHGTHLWIRRRTATGATSSGPSSSAARAGPPSSVACAGPASSLDDTGPISSAHVLVQGMSASNLRV
jgi:hypothetical protein